MIPPFWAVLTVGLASLGACLSGVWEMYRGNRVAGWGRLVGGFVVVGLNFSALIVVFQGYSFDFARLILRVALFADTLVAGLMFGSAVSVTLVPWWRSWRDGRRRAR